MTVTPQIVVPESGDGAVAEIDLNEDVEGEVATAASVAVKVEHDRR